MAKGYSARRGFSNGSGQMLKQQQMQQQIMKMQEDMQKAQQEVEEKTFSASVGGGVVSAEVNGKKEVTNITIKPEAVDPEDVEMLQDLIISAVNEALRQAEEAMDGKMNALTSGLGLSGLLKPCRVLRSAKMTAFWRSSSRAFCQSAGSAKARSSCWIRLPPRSPITPPTTPCRNFSIVWSVFPISMRRSCQSGVSVIMTIWN